MWTRSTARLALLAAVPLVAVLLATLPAAGPATAQSPAPAPSGPSETARNVAGTQWEFSNADRDRRCSVAFRTDAAGSPGMKLELEKSCTGLFPFLREAAAWTLGENDFLRFVDARGRVMLEFSEVEQGLWEAPKPGEGILFLQTVASLKRPPPSLDDMAGQWSLTRGGRTLCAVTLAATPAGDAFALKLGTNCDAVVARFAPTTWSMDRDELVLNGARNQTWRFEETDPKTWQRVPETPDPILMVKQ
ncbi:MAG: AprI/Inh family metalloprotease inhibitor [Rhodoplanes sp.]|uniref:AprI/Inh family metalloprotease inhibitor n=1 Tax=Rhodoplanes sp. TaxID=1968906 RepID=UPI0017A562CB|nr:AprI/Inh family metalloprotease inhibitor [Rhodoplanes sp.]NVO12779.1 AprI/Inh family metalloprotease inhibitor [Rhodoplanes sp.]